jgi:malate synthase
MAIARIEAADFMSTMPNGIFSIPYYHDYISPPLARKLLSDATPVSGVKGLVEVGRGGGLETKESLQFLVDIYSAVEANLAKVLKQRILDRVFIDERVRATSLFNDEMGREISDSDYRTIIGLEDGSGRIVIGPKRADYASASSGAKPIAPIPEVLQGSHVTLFGPPDTAKMAINAMNTFHRKLKNEPPIIEKLLSKSAITPKWGADDEDSKTPLREDLVEAGQNLTACFEGTLRIDGDDRYVLAKDKLSLPIKRFPGLALPATFLFYNGNPIPLHIYDFALHLFRNWKNPKALTFYVPKLENEEEAAYIQKMIATAEKMLQAKHSEYKLGTVRLMVVLENPRAILRTHEIIDALHPYFVGASLGWHDYLGSTARIFKEDSHYRIPVKADPDIVIKYIHASHRMLADVVGSRGGIKVGGMYGILPQDPALDSPSFQMTLLGYIKDVITQMKRDLTGFWVAHPDFVRLGLALVEAWKQHASGKPEALKELVTSLLQENYHKEILDFISAPDIKGLDKADPNYVRSLIVADIKESDFIANNHPDEIRYNVFQSLQYLTDWLSGNGCVALPAIVRGVPVRVMDDLATAERSRWEVWHEIYHGRFKLEDFIRIAFEEMHFIRKDLSDAKKIVQVKWDERSERWYPIAFKLMLKLMTDKKPAEFATELLMPFTIDSIRTASDPWSAICAIDSEKFALAPEVQRLNHYFEACGCLRFAVEMAKNPFQDLELAENIIRSFTLEEILEAASFHGDIGQAKKGLDAQASSEQSKVLNEGEQLRQELLRLANGYLERHGFKFLVSAKDKSAHELLEVLKLRLKRTTLVELNEAREALWHITNKRLTANPHDSVIKTLQDVLARHKITGASISVNSGAHTQVISLGEAVHGKRPVTSSTKFEIASLSKTFASAYALEYFRKKGIALEAPVDELFAKTKSPFRVGNSELRLEHLLNHTALNMHYVNGVADQPNAGEILANPSKFGYEAIKVINSPGSKFSYSGGGFIVLEHLLESLEGRSIAEDFANFSGTTLANESRAHGYFDDGTEVANGALEFPLFAAGSWMTTEEVAKFLRMLTKSFASVEGTAQISHDTAVRMLHGRDKGSREFMSADMGLGVFIKEAADNRFMLHQGANEGFRALFLHCYSGPDCGKGFVICANGDNRAVGFIAEASQALLKSLKIDGVDQSKFQNEFDFSKISQEQIVNLGYKKLLLDAFLPTLPPKIERPKKLIPNSERNVLADATLDYVSNDRFARAENLLSPFEPVFDPELFCAQGKVMDSWESARHNDETYHVLRCSLKTPSPLSYAWISTKFHDGNQVEYLRILARETSNSPWIEILAKTHLAGHSEIKLRLEKHSSKFSQIEIQAYPDGGLTRLALYAELPASEATSYVEPAQAKSHRHKEVIQKTSKPLVIPYSPTESEIQKNRLNSRAKMLDQASLAYGGNILHVSNEHYGPGAQVISPFIPLHMFDGFESARSRTVDHCEEIELKLARSARVRKIRFDFKYFVNNNPRAVSILGKKSGEWVLLAPKTNVKAFAGNQIDIDVSSKEMFSELLVKVYPDGGINRIHVFTD